MSKRGVLELSGEERRVEKPFPRQSRTKNSSHVDVDFAAVPRTCSIISFEPGYWHGSSFCRCAPDSLYYHFPFLWQFSYVKMEKLPLGELTRCRC